MSATDLGKLALTELPEDAQFTTESDAPGTPEYACEVCGKELTYGGRGRKPKYCEEHKKGSASKIGTAKPRSSSKDVEAAVATLDSWYTMLSFGLLATGARQSASLLSESADGLKSKNQEFLSQSPALAKRIAEMGKTSAMFGFIAAQVSVLGPVAVLATGEYVAKYGAPKRDSAPEDFPDEMPVTVNGFPIG